MGRQSYIVPRHSEGGSRTNQRVVSRNFPTSELVSVFRRLSRGNRNQFASGIEGFRVRVPRAAIRIVGHDVISHVLRIEVHVLSNSAGERDIGSSQVAISAPCDQAVRTAVGDLRFGQAAHAAGNAHRFALAHRFAALVLVGSRTGVPQVKPGRCESFGLNHDLAIYMIAITIVRNFVRNERYALDVFRSDIATFNGSFVSFENIVPGISSLGNNAARHVFGPLDDTIWLGGDIAILIVVDPHCSLNVDLSISQAGAPLIRVVGVRIRSGRL